MVTESKERTGELLAAISNMVVGVYADCLGRGPTRARSYMDHDIVLCLLEDTMTKPERQLMVAGHSTGLRELRSTLHETMEGSLIAGMERLLGRRVKAVISGRQVEPDVVAEVFLIGEALDGDPTDGRPQESQTPPPGGAVGDEGGTLQKE